MTAFVTLSVALLMQAQSVDECASARTSESDRHALTASLLTGRAVDEAVVDRLLASWTACAGGLTLTESAIGSVAATVAGVELRRDLAAVGIDPDRVARWFAAQPDARRITPVLTVAAGNEALDGIAATGVDRALADRHSMLIGAYVASLVIIERGKRRLSLQP